MGRLGFLRVSGFLGFWGVGFRVRGLGGLKETTGGEFRVHRASIGLL